MNLPANRGFNSLVVTAVVEETADARSYVLAVPPHLADAYAYRAGQYLTFRLPVGEEPVLRCYSMSSAPQTGEPLRTTVKRVPGGIGSNWFIDNVSVGNVVEVTVPAGGFVLADEPGPVVAYAAGSGITPVLSIVKSALASTDRPVRLLYANRGRASVIFADELDDLVAAYPDRLAITNHLDDRDGYVSAAEVRAVAGADAGVTVYLCGPTPFMDLVESALASRVARILSERFVQPDTPIPSEEPTADAGRAVVITLGRTTVELTYREGDTILETARRGGLNPPFSCQLGNCATCMAQVSEGEVRMRANEALFPEEVDDGWILTCQSVPTTPLVRVTYPVL